MHERIRVRLTWASSKSVIASNCGSSSRTLLSSSRTRKRCEPTGYLKTFVSGLVMCVRVSGYEAFVSGVGVEGVEVSVDGGHEFGKASVQPGVARGDGMFRRVRCLFGCADSGLV